MVNCRMWDWTWAGNTPFRRWKRANCRGSDGDPFVVRRPSGIRTRDEVRAVRPPVDLVPTLLGVLGVKPLDTFKGLTQSTFIAARRIPPGADREAVRPGCPNSPVIRYGYRL
jgi:arylsulfatase A-like enzyme